MNFYPEYIRKCPENSNTQNSKLSRIYIYIYIFQSLDPHT